MSVLSIFISFVSSQSLSHTYILYTCIYVIHTLYSYMYEQYNRPEA